MRKLALFLPLILFGEVDPFNLNSSNPDYLTPTEKAILQNKKEIKKLKNRLQSVIQKEKKKFFEYDMRIKELENRAASFKTLVDNIELLGKEIENLKSKSLKVENNNQKMNKKIESLEREVNSLKEEIKVVKESIKKLSEIQNKNFHTLSLTLNEVLKELKAVNAKKSSPSLKEILSQAKEAFKKGDYKKAKELFTYTYNKGYYKATSAFYLGEIHYLWKQYKKALAFYKESVKIYPKKTSFTDRLLYHTGRSFMKLGEKELAKITFNKLINDFPNSFYSKLAKKDLEKLN